MEAPHHPTETADIEKSEDISQSPPEASSSSTSPSTINDPVPLPTDRHESPDPKKTPFWKQVWAKLGFNPTVVMFMIKGALAPTICMAMYQRHSLAAHYLNLGYLMIIISILTVPILPRGKFLMNLFISLILTCFAAAMVLFGHWCGNQARKHTTPAGAPLKIAHGYNSSASAINAIFMIVNIFAINTLRAARPSVTIPSIQYTIYVLVGFSYGPQEATNEFSLRFTRELFYAFLTGQAVCAGVSLFIIPVSSRKVFFAEGTGFLQSSRGLLKAQLAFVEALENSQMCEPSVPRSDALSEDKTSIEKNENGQSDITAKTLIYNQRKAALRQASAGVIGLASKLREDVMFAKREIAYGHFGSADIHEFHLLLRNIMLPISGLSTISDIEERLRSRYRSDRRKFEELQCPKARNIEIPDKHQASEQAEWQELLQALHTSFEPVIQVLDEGFLHVMILLNLSPNPKKASKVAPSENGTAGSAEDVEKGIPTPVPGDLGFADYLDREIQGFRERRTESLEAWAKERGMDSIFHTSAKHVHWPSEPDHEGYRTLRSLREMRTAQRLHLILYMEYLLYSVAKAALALVRFAETKVDDGTMKKKRLIFPAMSTIRKWIRNIIRGEDSSPDINNLDHMMGNVETIYLGDSLKIPKDPEHLPPKNFKQALGNKLRVIPRILGSNAVHFGARVTIGSMSIGIMAYLKNSHAFYIRERLVWGMVMIAIGMNPTSGFAVFTLLGNLTATLVGMVCAIINWYIVDQKTVGVIIFFFFFQMLYFYFAAKHPRFLVAIVAGAITHVLIIGYELQVRVIGKKIATATGQSYLPIYELAPYRLLTVAGGVTVAYIWTIFPVPITEGTVLRRNLGDSLFLLAKYLSSVTSTVEQRVHDKEGDMTVRTSPGRRLEKMRLRVLQKQLALLISMRQNLAFMAWEPTFGGEFPKATYQAIITEVQNAVNYLTIIAYASEAFQNARSASSSSVWLSRFGRSRNETNLRSHEVTTLLSLLSASLQNKQPLPPYLQPPNLVHMSEQIQGSDASILSMSNINEPGFRAFAVIEVANYCLVDSAANILKHVKDLLGEVDFTYQIKTSSARTSSTLIGETAEGKQKAH